MAEPNILAWTQLSYRFIAKAWTDSTFLASLLATPNKVITMYIFNAPQTFNYIVVQDSGTTRNLTLPFIPAEFTQWTQDQVFAKLLSETLGDISLEYYLPASVLAKAFYDATYQSNLIANPNSVLSSSGFSGPIGGNTYVVNANTATDHYLTIPVQPVEWVGLDYYGLLSKLLSSAIEASIGV